MLEQQQQHQLLAAAVAASASQTQQLKQLQQQQQQQQRTSPLQQSLMAFAGLQPNLALQNRAIPTAVPVGNRTHFRPIHPQPMIPPLTGIYNVLLSFFPKKKDSQKLFCCNIVLVFAK